MQLPPGPNSLRGIDAAVAAHRSSFSHLVDLIGNWIEKPDAEQLPSLQALTCHEGKQDLIHKITPDLVSRKGYRWETGAGVGICRFGVCHSQSLSGEMGGERSN